MFSQLAKRSPCVVVSGYLQYFSHSKYFLDFLEARSEPEEEIRNALKIEKNITMHLQLFGDSYQLYGAICCIFQALQREIVEQKK